MVLVCCTENYLQRANIFHHVKKKWNNWIMRGTAQTKKIILCIANYLACRQTMIHTYILTTHSFLVYRQRIGANRYHLVLNDKEQQHRHAQIQHNAAKQIQTTSIIGYGRNDLVSYGVLDNFRES